MSEGYIKVDRKLLEWRYFSKVGYLQVWMFLLLKANHKSGLFEDVVVKRGQLITSIDKISKNTGVSTQRVRTILKKLEGEELTSKSTNKYTLITILKYRDYQDCIVKTNKHINKQLTNKQQTTNKQLTTNNNKKNIEEDNNNILEQNEIAKEVTMMIDSYREANYDEKIIGKTINIFDYLKIPITTKMFPKVLDVVENDEIINKNGYCYEMFKREGIV